jgi:Ca2+/H+ antiporter, TMEM165/GDT1 family
MEEESIEEKIKEVEKEVNQSMMSFEVDEEGGDSLVGSKKKHAH